MSRRRPAAVLSLLFRLFETDLLPASGPSSRAARRGIWGVILLCCGAEALFQLQAAGQAGGLGAALSAGGLPARGLAVQYAGFWPGLLDNWRPNYPGQPVAMFFTYGLIHADLWHLLGNMVLFGVLGRAAAAQSGTWGLMVLLWGSVVAGGAGFALLATGTQPMVGLSGGLFGLIAACQLWHARRLARQGASLKRVVLFSLWLILLNLAFWILQQGSLAWEAHLGGYLGGALIALMLPARQAGPRLAHHKAVK